MKYKEMVDENGVIRIVKYDSFINQSDVLKLVGELESLKVKLETECENTTNRYQEIINKAIASKNLAVNDIQSEIDELEAIINKTP